MLASRVVDAGIRQTDLSVPDVHCGGCIRKIEDAVERLPGVQRARLNLSTKRLAITWRESDGPPPLGATLEQLGYEAHLFETREDGRDLQFSRLIRALAVAGFAAMNIMGLSVSVWSGAAGETRDLFHWLSAAIALPALAYSGRIFFQSAWQALRHGQTNMDVPISIGVLLAFAMSLYDAAHHEPYAYFDASISLLFFLLIGRTLDHLMRERARTAVKGLGRLATYGATIINADGTRSYVPTEEIIPGMTILIMAGERVPVDATVETGCSDVDVSLATGESAPEQAIPGRALRQGTLNLTGPLTLTAAAAAKDSFLAEMIRLMEVAEGGRSRYRRLADRAAGLYAPVVHSAAFVSFVGWMLATGDLHRALTIAVAVLIITCPCALGLAVPMVQVVAARRLYEHGIMVKDGSAMERLTEIDRIIFDKTGTLTSGRPSLRHDAAMDGAHLSIAARLAANSRHPYARALAQASEQADIAFDSIVEKAGQGMEARIEDSVWRLGRNEWALKNFDAGKAACTVLACNGRLVQAFAFEDELRKGARETVANLRSDGFTLEIMSGDATDAVARVAADLGIDKWQAQLLPGEKTAHLAELAGTGSKVLMVGDGLNDAPALVAAHVSMAPGSAADVGRQAADFVFLNSNLDSVPYAIRVARSADRLIRQNFAFAAIYNAIALPIAIAGLVTPLIAALAMSGSSILVVANALRLRPAKAARLVRRESAELGTTQRAGAGIT
nr:cation-translocating P-type ATPase [Sphingobium nicotianae]